MANTLQPILACGNPSSTDLTVFLQHGGETYEVYIGLALLERVGIDRESLARKMLVGRLFNAGVPLRRLHEAFGHDDRTVKKWGAAILSNDPELMVGAFRGRGGGGTITPEMVRYARLLYRERHILGRTYRQMIITRIYEVFQVRLSPTAVSALYRSETPEDASCQAPDMATGERTVPVSSSDFESSVKRSPVFPPVLGTFPGAGAVRLAHHVGLALFADGMKGFADPLRRQIIGQLLQGAVNVEQSKTMCGSSLEHFTGPVLSSLKVQRDGLAGQADADGVMDVYRRNAELLPDGPEKGDVFFFDPHVKEYTGQLKILKDWCGRRHGVAKAVNMDTFHTRSGRPCFVRHYDGYYDMRQRFFISLAQFDQLFSPERRKGRTFVIDRGIYGLGALQSFGDDYVITWEKGYDGGGWDNKAETAEFTRNRSGNREGDKRPVTFRCQQTAWERDGSFRRIVVRVDRPGRAVIEVSVLTSNPHMDIRDVVWAIFQRWLQENDFKYLDAHFGFCQLDSRDSLSFEDHADLFQDRQVESPEHAKLKKQLDKLETRLGKRLIEQKRAEKTIRIVEKERSRLETELKILNAKISLNPECPDSREQRRGEVVGQLTKTRRKLNALEKKQAKIKRKVDELEKEIEPLECQICAMAKKESRLQLFVNGGYRYLDTRRKSMMDALRISASNIFRNVQAQFRAIRDNYRDDHVLVRTLSRCSGTIREEGESLVFTLWLPGTFQAGVIKDFEKLLRRLENQANANLQAPRPMRLRLTTGPIRI